MLEDIIATPTVSAGDGGSDNAGPIDLTGLDYTQVSDWGLVYIFPGTRSQDIEVVGASDESTGITVPAGVPWLVGPYRGQYGDDHSEPQHLHASSQEDVDVIVARTEGDQFESRALRDPWLDADAAEETSLADSGTLSVTLECYDADKIIYVAESDESFQVDVQHHAQGGQSGHSVTQDASGGSVSGGEVDGQVVRSGGLSATVTLNDQSSDGGDSATATLLAKAV